MNAHRRSPARPCHETSAPSSASAAMDFTGYRHSAATRPTTVMTASIDLEGALTGAAGVERGGPGPSQRLSTPPTCHNRRTTATASGRTAELPARLGQPGTRPTSPREAKAWSLAIFMRRVHFAQLSLERTWYDDRWSESCGPGVDVRRGGPCLRGACRLGPAAQPWAVIRLEGAARWFVRGHGGPLPNDPVRCRCRPPRGLDPGRPGRLSRGGR